jgi:hypothetical protein
MTVAPITQPDGTTIGDTNYNTLCSIRLQQTALLPAGSTGYRAFTLSDILLFERDGLHDYPGTTFPAYIGGIPVVPEFPLGLGFVMLLAPAIPIVYLWRTRKKVMRK